jgi:hypothetical protein
MTPTALHPDLAGLLAGLALAFTIWLLPSCEEHDPYDPPPLWIDLQKRPAEPVIITPADGCWYGGEKMRGTAEWMPQS